MPHQIELVRGVVAGLKFHQAWNLPKPIYQDTVASLVREPSNKYDPNAIQIIAKDGVMLGYIPRTQTVIIHANWHRNPTALITLHQPKAIVFDVYVDEVTAETTNENRPTN